MTDRRGPVLFPSHRQADAHAHAQRIGGAAVRADGGGWGVITADLPLPAAWQATPTARTTDPTTSHQAAVRATSRAQINRDLLLVAHFDAGHDGLTGDDIETATGLPYQTIGPRRPDLERAGLVAKAIGDDGQPVCRNDKQVYRITSTGAIRARQLKETAA